MSEEEGMQVSLPPRPADGDPEAWKTYWEARGQPWRTEPEISPERKAELAQCRAIVPNIQKGMYPFKGMKLNRADIEWLLATHESGGIQGPVNWNDGCQRERLGLDLRGANLSQEDLEGLPLAGTLGGVMERTWIFTPEEQRTMAAVCMEKATLAGTQLQGATLVGAQLQGANLWGAQLQGATLGWAQLQGATLWEAQLQGATLRGVQLDSGGQKDPILNEDTYRPALLADATWGEVNLAVIDWPVKMLGDEHRAHQTKDVKAYRAAVRANRQLAVALRDQGLNEEADRFAYRAQKLQRVVFRREGLEPDRGFWQRLGKFSSYVLSLFLDALAGYGYHPAKTLFWYLLVIGGFTTTYALFGHLPPFPDALVFSFMSFHGRGFFPSITNETNLHNSLVVFAAAEAVIGLLIEVSLIATFTQRFFGG